MDQLLAILQGQSQLVSFVLIGVAFFCVTWVLSNVARQLFSLYQKNFYQQVDKGLRDVVVMMEPGQIQPQPLAQEFTQVLVEYRVGSDLNESLDALAKRIGRDDLLLMNSAIKISRTVGGNLADTLEVLSRTLREKSKVEGKIRALTSMGKAQGTLATFFPVFIGYVFYKIEPEAMSMLFTTNLGLIWLGVMITMSVMAFFMIQKIVNVDV